MADKELEASKGSDTRESGSPHVGVTVHCLDTRIKKSLDSCMERNGLANHTRITDWIMRFLWEHREKDVYQRDIEKQFSIGRSTVTGLLKTLEKDGYIVRQSVSGDARLKRVVLTPEGEARQERIIDTLTDFNVRLIDGVSKEQLSVFMETINIIMKNLDKEEI